MQRISRQFPRDYRNEVNAILEAGWRAKATKKGVVFLSPDGVGSVVLHKTPSDRRGRANFLAEVRRISGQSLAL